MVGGSAKLKIKNTISTALIQSNRGDQLLQKYLCAISALAKLEMS